MVPLESCMILLDNSEYMRNGDYIPTRLEAQHDAANMLVSAKTRNPESTVGVTAGTELLVSPTDEMGKILSALNGVPMKETQPDVVASVQVASLALKHRRNKNGGQRIVLFCGSPLSGVETRGLTRAGKQLKKNNVAIDVVAMGELEENESKLRELVEAANGRGDDGQRTCHLVTIPAGVLPSDVLASSPIVNGAGVGGDTGGFGAPAGGDDLGGAFAEFGGIDPNTDPELAMALRVSMEEERARQERAAAAAAATTSAEEVKDGEEAAAPAAAPAMDLGLSEEEALLQQALAMSMNENEPVAETKEDAAEAPASMDTEEDDEAAMQMALQMSMQPESDDKGEATAEQQHFQDPQFVNQLLGSLPGVDPNDPQIQEALRSINEGTKKEEGGDKKDEQKKE